MILYNYIYIYIYNTQICIIYFILHMFVLSNVVFLVLQNVIRDTKRVDIARSLAINYNNSLFVLSRRHHHRLLRSSEYHVLRSES